MNENHDEKGRFAPSRAERLTHAAMRDTTGRIHLGRSHMEAENRGWMKNRKFDRTDEANEGFRTNVRQFISRAEAGRLAHAQGHTPVAFKHFGAEMMRELPYWREPKHVKRYRPIL